MNEMHFQSLGELTNSTGWPLLRVGYPVHIRVQGGMETNQTNECSNTAGNIYYGRTNEF